MLGIHKDHYYAYWLEPINNENTIEHMELYYVGEEAANSKKFKSLRKSIYTLRLNLSGESLVLPPFSKRSLVLSINVFAND